MRKVFLCRLYPPYKFLSFVQSLHGAQNEIERLTSHELQQFDEPYTSSKKTITVPSLGLIRIDEYRLAVSDYVYQ